MKKYTDLHCHPTVKPFLKAATNDSRGDIYDKHEYKIVVDDFLAGDRLDSQSSLDQMKGGGHLVEVAGIALYSIEKELASVLRNGMRIMPKDRVNKPLVRRINKGKVKYYDIFKQELEYLMHQRNKFDVSDARGFHIPQVGGKLKSGRANFILTIEGAHNFLNSAYPTKSGRPSLLLSNRKFSASDKRNWLNNLKEVKEDGRFNVFFITPCHLAANPCGSHAWGRSNNQKVRHYPNYGATPGLTEDGKDFIRLCLENTASGSGQSNRILIDIKHMSLHTRLDFYQMLQDEFSGEQIPIIASHVAPNGYNLGNYKLEYPSVSDVRPRDKRVTKLIRKSRGLGRHFFNSTTMNLFDEEVAHIVKSQGYLGVSLDQRIVGIGSGAYVNHYKKTPVNQYFREIIHENEWKSVLQNPMRESLMSSFGRTKSYSGDLGPTLSVRNKHLHAVANAMLRFAWAGGEQTWKHMSIGSDYDGMIDAVNCCKSIDKLPILEDQLNQAIPLLMGYDSSTDYHVSDLGQNLRDVFYHNVARRFEFE